MKKEFKHGVNYITSDYFAKFPTEDGAIYQFQEMQQFYGNLGYLTTSTIHLKNHKIELCIHFDNFTLPRPHSASVYSYRELTSHTYWSEYDKKSVRVRCCTYFFEF